MSKRKPKDRQGADTYTSDDLCRRYSCCQRTLLRWERERGFPKHTRGGRENLYDKEQVHAWERKHMPQLHSEPEKSDEDKKWDLMYRQRQLDKESEALAAKNPATTTNNPKRPKVAKRKK